MVSPPLGESEGALTNEAPQSLPLGGSWRGPYKTMEGKIIDLPKIFDPRGNLTVAEGNRNIPFDIARAYWVYDVPGGESRGGHAHKHCREFIIAVSGSFQVTLDNGRERTTYHLNHPYQGLLVETGVWRTLDDFSSGAVCLVLASDPFEEEDYIRDYGDYLKYMGMGR